MKRHEHLFQFNGKQISDAAREEYGYHVGRVAWWKKEQAATIEQAKAKGVEVREYEITGGKSTQMVIDTSCNARLTECANKINSHQSAADRFQIEAATYGTQADRVYELHAEDVVYFRLAGGARPE